MLHILKLGPFHGDFMFFLSAWPALISMALIYITWPAISEVSVQIGEAIRPKSLALSHHDSRSFNQGSMALEQSRLMM